MGSDESLRCLAATAAARDVAESLAGDARWSADATGVYLPYLWFRAVGSAPTPFGRRPLSIDCLVDAQSGEAATSDPLSLIEQPNQHDSVLPQRVASSVARKAAQRCVSNALWRKLRTLADFRLEFEDRGLVHKAFWIVASGAESVLVDSVTGGWYPLRRSAAPPADDLDAQALAGGAR